MRAADHERDGGAGGYARVPPREQLLGRMAERAAGRPGRRDGLLVHDVPQAELRSTRPWPVKHSPRDTAALVVAHLERVLDAQSSPVERLAERWAILRGIETGADPFSPRIQRKLNAQLRDELAARGHVTGDPILELPPGSEGRTPWRDHRELFARSPEPRAVLYGAIDEADHVNLVWLRGGTEPPPGVLDVLEPWRDVLRARAEFQRNPRRKWWETAWPRDRTTLLGPKIIALHRTDRGRFALDEAPGPRTAPDDRHGRRARPTPRRGGRARLYPQPHVDRTRRGRRGSPRSARADAPGRSPSLTRGPAQRARTGQPDGVGGGDRTTPNRDRCLLADGRALVEAVERLVCALNNVPDALTERVVESAVTRAGTVAESGK